MRFIIGTEGFWHRDTVYLIPGSIKRPDRLVIIPKNPGIPVEFIDKLKENTDD